MEWLLLLLAGSGGGLVVARRLGARRARERRHSEALDGVRRLADEDVTLFGEQLQHLSPSLADHTVDTESRLELQRALDAYEAAQRAAADLRDPDEVSKVTDALATGRYALACVRARAAGREVPEQRISCFFNPQHGPSVTDVVWTRPGHATRTVPACAQDAARVAAREKPDLRTVRIGARTVPYWEAGAAYLPYSRGYFPAAILPAGGTHSPFVPPVGSGPSDSGGAVGGHHGEAGGWFGGDLGGGGR